MKIFAIISTLIFISALIGFYFLEKSKHGTGGKAKPHTIWCLLAFGFIVRVVLAMSIEGFSSDVGLFRYWSERAAEDLFHIYQGDFFIDYPPFYIYILFIIGKISGFLGLGDGPLNLLLLKLPSILADLGTAFMLYYLAKDRLPGKWPLLAASLYIFNPAVLINSSVWGQVDSFLVLLLALGFIMLDSKKPEFAGLPFAAAVLTKPQGLILLPVVLFELLKRGNWKALIKTAVYGILTVILLILPFAVNQEPSWIFKLYVNTAEGYKYASLNAFNFFSLIGANLKPDSEKLLFVSYQAWGSFFIAAMLIFTAVMYRKGKGRPLMYISALVLFMGVFMFSIRMHERYMFPVMFFLAVLFIVTRDKWGLAFYGAASFTIYVNTFVVLDRMIKDNYPHVSPDDPVLLLISLINVLLFIAILVWAWNAAIKGKTSPLHMEGASMLREGSSLWFSKGRRIYDPRFQDYAPLKIDKKDVLLMSCMTIIYLAVALINLGSFNVPETEWVSETTNDGFIIKLESETEVTRLNFYSGLGKGSYLVWALDADGAYQSMEEDLEVDDFYKWHAYEVNQTVSGFKIRAKQPGGMIKEIGVFSHDKEKPLPVKIYNLDGSPADGELLHLVDEQHLVQYRQRDFMTSTYFDEIYHPRTAYEHLNRIRPYEWTHPPLGKILISIGIAVFGMNTFGWRIVGTLTGVIMIPIMYLFGKKLFQKRFYAFCSAFLMMFDLMHFAQTRLATIDSYTALFVMLMYYFMTDYYLQKSYQKGFYKSLKPLFLSGLFFGLGAATKWSALYGAPGLAFIFFMAKYSEYKDYKAARSQASEKGAKNVPAWVDKFMPVYMWKTMLYCVLFFVIIPAAIYFLSYIPYLMVPGMEVSDILKYQKSMYDYHSGLESTHDFQSSWWTWPFMIRPIWYYNGRDLPAGMASTIVSLGNPAVWWMGIPAFFIALRAAWRGNKSVILVVTAIISQYIPWIFISRSAFIYHFFPMVPFLILTVVYLIKKWIEEGKSMKYVYGYLALVLVLFIMFYPAISGLIVPKAYIRFLRWFPSWYF